MPLKVPSLICKAFVVICKASNVQLQHKFLASSKDWAGRQSCGVGTGSGAQRGRALAMGAVFRGGRWLCLLIHRDNSPPNALLSSVSHTTGLGLQERGRLALGWCIPSGWFQFKAVLQESGNLFLGFCPSQCCATESPCVGNGFHNSKCQGAAGQLRVVP